ncbi:MAG: AMP-dependent CoA ligase/synthetase [Firmicutes bacterium]|nr:AMP-dependent CoA ligase/synthetase [Bacillota bacterium]
MDFIGKQPGKTTLTSTGISTIRGHVKKHPDRIALKTEGFSETYAEMWQRCMQLANALLALDLKKPDLVATYMPNSYQFVEVVVAAEMIGLPITLGNYRLTPEEIIYQINNCEAKVIFVKQEQYDLISPLLDRLPTIKEIVLISDTKVDGALNYEELIASGSKEEPRVEVLPEDMHLLFYTSGTTGKPKGAVRTMYCDYNMAISTALELGLSRDDSMLVVAPMYAAATTGYFLTMLTVGGTLCIAPAFVPEESLRLIDLHKPSFVFMVPIMYDWMLSLPPETIAKYDLSSVRLAVACGAPMHSTIFRKMADLKIVDDKAQEVGPGGIGVLYSRSPATFDGYWHNPEGTQESFLDHEWTSVGDMARIDEDGYIYLVDRAKDMIVSGGTNIYPAEVEGVILKLNGIADVGVIGVPDEKWGEQVKAIVVLKPGYSISEEDVITHCRQYLAGFKVPKSVDYADAIPRNAVGKMLKKELRKPYWEGQKSFIS